jgi:glycine hydroxymethyltransferase
MAAISNDLVQRYGDYAGRDLKARRYRGGKHLIQIEEGTNQLAADLFRAKSVELRPLSGHLAGVAVVMAVCRAGDIVLELDRESGGHREAGRITSSTTFPLDIRPLPFDATRYNVDTSAAVDAIARFRPRLVILGSSNFLFPHPVREIVAAAQDIGDCVVAYDASHVLGFIACGMFQDPLAEGAHVVFGSTHKTFPGPQGGIVFSNDEALMGRVSSALSPGLVTNHHPFRYPAMALAIVEMNRWGSSYLGAVCSNAKSMAAKLDQRGVKCVSSDGVPTESHTILLKVSEYGSGEAIAARLEKVGIIATHARLPAVHGAEGIQIGTQEVTRMRAGEHVMHQIASLVADAVTRSRSDEAISRDRVDLVRSFGPVQYTWSPAAARNQGVPTARLVSQR